MSRIRVPDGIPTWDPCDFVAGPEIVNGLLLRSIVIRVRTEFEVHSLTRS